MMIIYKQLETKMMKNDQKQEYSAPVVEGFIFLKWSRSCCWIQKVLPPNMVVEQSGRMDTG